MSAPFKGHARTWHEAGWPVLPVVEKTLIVKGRTGRDGIDFTTTELEKVLAVYTQPIAEFNAHWHKANLALRLLAGMVAIDVDAYKGDLERVREWERVYGALPPTYVFDARGGPGGKYLYWLHPLVHRAIEDGTHKVRSKLDVGITMCHRHHRYVVAPPSIHAELGLTYWCYFGSPTRGVVDTCGEIPTPTECTTLTEIQSWALVEWANEQILNPSRGPAPTLDNLPAILDRGMGPCRYMENILERAREQLHISVHDILKDRIREIFGAVNEKHTGGRQALLQLGVYAHEFGRRTPEDKDWRDQVDWYLANFGADIENIKPDEHCECWGLQGWTIRVATSTSIRTWETTHLLDFARQMLSDQGHPQPKAQWRQRKSHANKERDGEEPKDLCLRRFPIGGLHPSLAGLSSVASPCNAVADCPSCGRRRKYHVIKRLKHLCREESTLYVLKHLRSQSDAVKHAAQRSKAQRLIILHKDSSNTMIANKTVRLRNFRLETTPIMRDCVITLLESHDVKTVFQYQWSQGWQLADEPMSNFELEWHTPGWDLNQIRTVVTRLGFKLDDKDRLVPDGPVFVDGVAIWSIEALLKLSLPQMIEFVTLAEMAIEQTYVKAGQAVQHEYQMMKSENKRKRAADEGLKITKVKLTESRRSEGVCPGRS